MSDNTSNLLSTQLLNSNTNSNSPNTNSNSNSTQIPKINVQTQMAPLINPTSIIQTKCNTEITSTTKLNVSGLCNGFNTSDSDSSPGRTSRSSTISTVNEDNTNHVKKSHSHLKITELAHKVTDYLFATRRSIDVHPSPTSSSIEASSRQYTDSSNPSPVASRENSHLSLSSLARTGGRHLKTTKRRSFLARHLSPTRDSTHTNDTVNIPHNTSSSSLSSRNGKFAFHDEETPNRKNSHVKETHYVHVEYDPITRKRVLNTYEILSDLGAGQHGKVKLAKHIDTGNLVAIKIVDRTGKPALMLNSLSRGKKQTQEDKIRKEIAIMKKCDHPHVVKLIEVLDAESSRKIYLVLEYLEKGEVKWQLTQDDVFNKAKVNDPNLRYEDCVPEPLLTYNETRRIFGDTLCGLDYLHHQGIIHRDIKPSNLLVGKNNEVKISDFGVSFASNLDGEHQDDVELARTAGTPAFLAPELCAISGKAKVTYKIDIWALGVTLYCLLFGQLPFSAESEFKLFEKINNDEVTFPDVTRWRVAQKLSEKEFGAAKDLILRLLDKNPESRIEINQIREHKFLTDGIQGNKWLCENIAWDEGKKIDVSNEEVNEAIVGLGNRIKTRLSAAFRRHKKGEKDNLDDDANVSVSSMLKSFPMLSLKEDCSYILSEENNKNQSSVSLSLLDNQNAREKHVQSRPTTGLNMTNASFDFDCAEDEGDHQNLPLEASSPCKTADDAAAEGMAQTIDNHFGDDCQACDTEHTEYDYRDDLEQNGVKLTVNPSFASLDSFYDESYAKFMSPSASTGHSFGAGRPGVPTRASMRIPSNSTSPVVAPYEHSNGSNEMTIGRSPVTGLTLSGINGIRASKMVKSRTSPIHSTTNMGAFTVGSALRYPPSIGRTQHPMNPMIRSESNETKKVPPSGKSETYEKKTKSESPVLHTEQSFSTRTPNNPLINKLQSEGLGRSGSTSRRAIFTSGNNDSDEENDSDESVTFIAPKAHVNTPKNDDVPRTLNKNAIYGTKINLIQHLYDNSSADDNEETEDSEDELFLSFGKPRGNTIQKKPFSLPQLDTIPACVSMENVFTGSTPTIVDVPANIYQSESSSMGNSDKLSTPNFIISDPKTDEIVVMNSAEDDDLFGQR